MSNKKKIIIQKRSTIIDHGSSKPIGHNGNALTTPAYKPPHDIKGLNDDKWMVYQIGMVMADLIIASSKQYSSELQALSQDAKKYIDRCANSTFIQYLELAGKELSINDDFIDLLKMMIKENAINRIDIVTACERLNKLHHSQVCQTLK